MPKRLRPVQIGPLTRDFGARLTAAREQHGRTKYQLADATGLTRQRLIHFEQGTEHPKLYEVELIAQALDVPIADLIGLPPAEAATPLSSEVLEKLSEHLLAAVDLVMQLLKGQTTQEEPAEGEPAEEAAPLTHETTAKRKRSKKEESADFPWDKILPVAEWFLRKNPEKSWKPIELVRAIRGSGLRIPSYRGLHFAIVPQLYEAGLAVSGVGRTLKAKSAGGSVTATPRKQVSKPSSAKKERSVASIQDLVSAAKALLDAHPQRAWFAKEFVHALRETGVTLRSWRGVHLYLIKALKDQRAIESREDGTFLAAATAHQEPQIPASTASGESAQPPESVDYNAGIGALAHEVDGVAPRLTAMTPRERNAQIAAWAGRVRRMDDELDEKAVPSNSGMRGRLQQILKQLVKLRKALGCGWVDAMSAEWSTNWPIYIEYNRAVAASELPSLSLDEKKIYFRDILKSISRVRRKFARSIDAQPLIIEASQVLDESDPQLIEAKRRFGQHADRRAEESRPVAPFRRQGDAERRIAAANRDAQKDWIPRAVMKMTRGRSLLIAGGRGSHETQRLAVKKGLQFKLVDWITGDRHPNPADLFSLAIRNKRYDIVLLMPGTDDAEPLLMACKDTGSRLLYLTRGPSIPSVAEAISGQPVMSGEGPEWVEAED